MKPEIPRSLLEIYPDIDEGVLKRFEDAIRAREDITVPISIFPKGYEIRLTYLAAIYPMSQNDEIYVTSLRKASDSIAETIASFYRTDMRNVSIKKYDGIGSFRT